MGIFRRAFEVILPFSSLKQQHHHQVPIKTDSSFQSSTETKELPQMKPHSLQTNKVFKED